ncbi:MAG: hypothetical protein JW717_11560 [Marinilabiliaceae bacterium]|nr:hypothetical protein [Marinilabiliaceae bacterium]
MKKLNFYFNVLFIAAMSLTLFSCEDEETTVDPNPLDTAHFDIWVSIGGTGGMGSENTQLVQNTKDLDNASTVIDYKGTGVDVTAKLFQESIIKGQYYYQIPQEKDRFGKYRIGTTGIETIKEIAFGTNTYKDRRYAHAWIDDNTFVVLAANGDKDGIIWTKFNAADMTIIAEGTLEGLTDGLDAYSTSGLADYRASDNQILYSYCHNSSSKRDKVYMAFINANDMSVVKTVEDNRASFMAGTAYGQLLQDKAFFDENGDYYLACNTKIDDGNTSSTEQYGSLLRIKAGATDFDQSYLGYRTGSNGKGKLITVQSLESGKALLYVQDPEYTQAAGWGSNYNCFYAILDLTTDEITVLDLPFSEGTFSQRSVVLGNKAYVGVNPENSAPCVYVYDIENKKLTKGLTITEGYSFDRIVTLEDAK